MVIANSATVVYKLQFYLVEYTPKRLPDGSEFVSSHLYYGRNPKFSIIKPRNLAHFHSGLVDFDFDEFFIFNFSYPNSLYHSEYSRVINMSIFYY